MPHRNMVAIGGSAGSIEALRRVVRDLPADFPAAVFVVVHSRARLHSGLAHLLSYAAKMNVAEAEDGERIEDGKIYVARPDYHLLLSDNHIHLSRGPKEGLHRPSINAMFRTAAACCDGKVVGVLLSGLLDDGASGLWEIVHNHGISIIQDPEEALFPSMPMAALEAVPINFKLKSTEIGPQLVKIVSTAEPDFGRDNPTVNEISRERFSGFTCPECRGPMYVHRSSPSEFICRVGHIFPLQTLLEELTSTQEKSLYQAIVSLEEGADLAEYAARQTNNGQREQLAAEASQLRRHSAEIRRLIEERKTPPVD
jgi:two-component system chemotaxis response regulator CheB